MGKLYCAMVAEYTGETKETSISYIYSGELPKCKKPEAKLFLNKVTERLRIKLKAEKEYGLPEEAENINNILLETEKIINEM
jgi:hypothetical protein